MCSSWASDELQNYVGMAAIKQDWAGMTSKQQQQQQKTTSEYFSTYVSNRHLSTYLCRLGQHAFLVNNTHKCEVVIMNRT